MHLISEDNVFDLFPNQGMPGNKNPEKNEHPSKNIKKD
jgi:hypothetical protein